MTEPRHRRRLLLAAAALWLVLGWAFLVRGAAHAGPRYRRWAFDHHSYSDLLAMGGDRYFGGGRPVPYLEDRIEYPPLLALALWAPSFAPGGPPAPPGPRWPAVYFTAGWALLAACGLGCVALLSRLPGARAWWLACTPALAYYGALNWDLLPILLLVAAVYALERGRHAGAGALTALGLSAKLWPVALVPPAVAALAARRQGRPLLRAAGAGLATFLTVNLPILLAAPAAWLWFWRFNARRGAENSAWEALRHVPSLRHLVFDARFLNLASLAPLLAAVGLAAWGAWRAPEAARVRAVRLGVALIVVTWIATSKVWSPQYALWAFAAGALAAAPGWLWALHAVMAPIDYHVAFETRARPALVHYFDAVYTTQELLRFGLYALLAAWMARALWRAAREPAPAPAAP